jgi:flagellar motor switch protein FliN/FliY
MSQLWMQKIEEGLEELKEVPLWGAPPAFMWEEFGNLLKTSLGGEQIRLSCQTTKWLDFADLTAALGKDPLVMAFSASPLEGNCYLAMNASDANALSSTLLSPDKKVKGFSEPKLRDGFITYIALEALHIVEQHKLFNNLSFTVAHFSGFPKGGTLCSDIQIEIGEKTLWARLICPPVFHRSFKNHFASERPSLQASPLLKQTEVPLSLQAGRVQLSQEEWRQVSVGDCILLDRCSLDLKSHKGTATLFLGQTPLFRIRIKQDHLKILDYAFYQEEEPMMDRDEEEKEHNESEPDDEFSLEAGKEDLTENPSEEQPAASEEHLWSSNAAAETLNPPIIPTEEIPIVLTVEVGRIKMSLEKLLQLVPGNLIELPIKPESAVHLTVDGKVVAKAEMVQIGEALGVKILKLGK